MCENKRWANVWSIFYGFTFKNSVICAYWRQIKLVNNLFLFEQFLNRSTIDVLSWSFITSDINWCIEYQSMISVLLFSVDLIDFVLLRRIFLLFKIIYFHGNFSCFISLNYSIWARFLTQGRFKRLKNLWLLETIFIQMFEDNQLCKIYCRYRWKFPFKALVNEIFYQTVYAIFISTNSQFRQNDSR